MKRSDGIVAYLCAHFDGYTSIEVTDARADLLSWDCRVFVRWRNGPASGRGLIGRSFLVDARTMKGAGDWTPLFEALVRDIEAWGWGQDCIAKHGMIVGVAGKPRKWSCA